MILSDRDWFRAREVIRRNKSRMDFLQRRFADPRVARAAAADVQRLESRNAELKEQLRHYDNLVRATGSAGLPCDLMGIAENLIDRRICNGLTQAELGNLLALDERTIRRYESTYYASARYSLLIRIDAALRQVELDRAAK